MYRNITFFFSFPYPKCTDGYCTGVSKVAELHTPRPRYESSVNPFFLPSLRLYNIHAYSHSHTSSSLPPTQSTGSRFLLSCNPHKLHGISIENICVLFTLATKCIFGYFCLMPLPRQMSKRYSRQYPTIILHLHLTCNFSILAFQPSSASRFLFRIRWFQMVSLFNRISTFVGYLMPKPFS